MALTEYQKKWRQDNRERILEQKRAAYQRNKEKRAEEHRRYRLENYDQQWYQRVKQRAEKRGVPFNLTIEDFVVPELCPVFGTPLVINDPTKLNSPSMDRVRPELGYVKGNVRVISYRANQVKSNSTIEEMEQVLNWLKKELT